MMFKLNSQLNGYQARVVINVLMHWVLVDKPRVLKHSVLRGNKPAYFLTIRDENWE